MNRDSIKYILQSAIDDKTFPGCAIVCFDSKEEYCEVFGKKTYDIDSDIISYDTMYDIASVTKVMVGAISIAILLDRGQINLEDNVSRYIPEFSTFGKEKISVGNLVFHNSGLSKVSGFYKDMGYDNFLKLIYDLPLSYDISSDIYYSDINYILLGKIVEIISGKTLDDFIIKEFFDKLGIKAKFGPIDKTISVPTRDIDSWYGGATWGFADDKKVAMMGGISGFAGLFASIGDIKKFLNFMISDGMGILTPEIMKMFYTQYKNTNRTLGWALNMKADMMTKVSYTPYTLGNNKGLPTQDAFMKLLGNNRSDQSIIQTGFTGCILAIDPIQHKYIGFITNRTYQAEDLSIFTNIFRDKLFECC